MMRLSLAIIYLWICTNVDATPTPVSDISCTTPDIQHGTVKEVKDNKKDDTLKYKCEPGYKPKQGTSKCTEQGWSPVPTCVAESSECPTELPKEDNADVSPASLKNSYSAGDKIQYTCKAGYTSKLEIGYVCSDHKWTQNHKGECISSDISCTTPDIQHGTVKEVKDNKKDDTLKYECDSGYKPGQETPKCTEQGWSPVPTCVAESSECPTELPKEDNADVSPASLKNSYSAGDKIQYTCKAGYTSKLEIGYVCSDHKWTQNHKGECISSDISCTTPDIQHGTVKEVKDNKKDDTLKYECDKGYKPGQETPKCTEQGWSPVPTCVAESSECPLELPKEDNADVSPASLKNSYSAGDKIQYTCKAGYTSKLEIGYVCSDHKWTQNHKGECISSDISCTTPDIQHGTVKEVKDNKKDDTLKYECDPGYKPGQETPKCTEQGWSPVPTCVAESSECPLELPKEDNADVSPASLKNSYSAGDKIQYTCKAGYTSKLEIGYVCSDHKWTQNHKGECIISDISCTTPNIQHGTVKEVKDNKKDDTLKYKCEPGYKPKQGTSKCTEQGWSPVPTCVAESSECPLELPKEDNADVSPASLKNSYSAGDKIQYTCKAGYTSKLEIGYVCSDHKWTQNHKGECISSDISCTTPNIQHGTVKEVKDNKKDDTLKYECDPGYKPGQETPKCTEQGWSPVPTCVAESSGSQNRCADCKGSKGAKESPSKTTQNRRPCKNRGREISCTPPDIQHGTVKQVKDYKKDDTLQYDCDPGYKPGQGTPKCTKQGWTPEPKCEEKTDSCNTPTVENGYIHTDRSKQRMIYYTCNPGYKPDTGTCWKAATCVKGIWRNVPRCIKVDECGALPSIQHGKLITKQSAVQIECDPGFEPSNTVIRCVRGAWQTPTCELDDNSCVSPPNVDNALIISEPQTVYSSGSVVNYKCLTDFTMSGNNQIECRNAKWEKAPTCEAFCSKPHQTLNNAVLIDKIQGERKYSHGDTALYKCYGDYESNGQTIAKCDAQTWIYPECTKRGQCTKPTMNLPFVTLLDEKKTFNNLEVLRYKCDKPYDKKPNGVLICKDGKWDGTFDCTSGICPAPPMIEHGDFKVEQKTGEVVTSVSYSCQPYFELNKQQRYYRCLNGKWETPPACLKPCKITPEICKEHNIKPVQDDHMRHSDNDFKLHCNDGWNVGGSLGHSHSKAWCKDGELKIESKCTVRNKRD
ncbi:complement factor H isoform X4 [Misgurnus anguillicaudatus]|uniref:complement factor H isoform X4 n=1 Tax=Misgurnus anguillicaudatus TaxID=75329 RepID=UPI003CCFC44E